MPKDFSRLLVSADDLSALGLDEILEACVCVSPQGRALKAEHRFFGPEERTLLEAEWRQIEALRDSRATSGHRPSARGSRSRSLDSQGLRLREDRKNALAALCRFRPIHGTIERLKAGFVLETPEFFEIKRSLGLLAELSRCVALLEAAELSIVPLPEAEALLNPEGQAVQGFHLYSSYSDALLQLRGEKRLLEQRILQAEPEEREKLLFQRAGLVSSEREEEGLVLQALSQRLRPFAPALEAGLNASARLDFLLARAQMAERWEVPAPIFEEAGSGTVIRDAFHPLVKARLKSKGLAFTPQSICLDQGTALISGPNMGGKSIALETFFLLLCLLQLGYPAPCASVRTELYEFLAFAREQRGESALGLSSFGMEAAALREQLRLGRKVRGLVVLDEPCRGTNPKEAGAMVRALCRIFVRVPSSLLLASHYRVPPGPGLRFYRIAGIRGEDLEQLAATTLETDAAEEEKTTERLDREAVRAIRERMDYRLLEADGKDDVPEAAIRIAEWMGIDQDTIREMRTAYHEEELWPH